LHPPAGTQDALQLVDAAVASAVCATRPNFHSSPNATPGGLAFGRDMVLDMPLIPDLQLIQEQRQRLIDDHLVAANQRRFSCDHNVGNKVLKLKHKPGAFRVE
jgi:hypothetical protein